MFICIRTFIPLPIYFQIIPIVHLYIINLNITTQCNKSTMKSSCLMLRRTTIKNVKQIYFLFNFHVHLLRVLNLIIVCLFQNCPHLELTPIPYVSKHLKEKYNCI